LEKKSLLFIFNLVFYGVGSLVEPQTEPQILIAGDLEFQGASFSRDDMTILVISPIKQANLIMIPKNVKLSRA
jgi:hypothetical protein